MQIRLKRHGILLRLLRAPLRRTRDVAVANESYFTWRYEKSSDEFVLSLLGILHGLIGLKVRTEAE